MANKPRVRLRETAFGHWIIVNAQDDRVSTGTYAWSGSRFVAIDNNGLPASQIQVSNWQSREEAAEHAREHGWEVVP